MPKMKMFKIIDRVSSHDTVTIPAAYGKSALHKFRAALLSTGIYYYEKHENWHLLSSYGSDFEAVPVIEEGSEESHNDPSDKDEIVGCFVDAVEDWLEGWLKKNGIYVSESSALICGADYDDLSTAFEKILADLGVVEKKNLPASSPVETVGAGEIHAGLESDPHE